MKSSDYAVLDTCSIPFSQIKQIDYRDLATTGVVYVWANDVHQPLTCSGFLALELVWLTSPAALEGVVGRVWKRHSWTLHNLVAHPLMEVLALIGMRRAAVWIHDSTVPKPDKEKWKRKYLANTNT